MIEHLDPPRLAAFERVLFEFAQPRTIVLTTPNSEYNVRWHTLPAGKFRHSDHNFEWSQAEFQTWAECVATQFGYVVRFTAIGDIDPEVEAPTQLGVFTLDEVSDGSCRNDYNFKDLCGTETCRHLAGFCALKAQLRMLYRLMGFARIFIYCLW